MDTIVAMMLSFNAAIDRIPFGIIVAKTRPIN